MKGNGSYVPPVYIPLGQSEEDYEALTAGNNELQASASAWISDGTVQWSSGICACCDDTPSFGISILSKESFHFGVQGCIGTFCPCYLFAKNAEFLGSGTLAGPCVVHCVLWTLASSGCFLYCVLLGLPGCVLSSYACNYRRILRTKYNLPEAPCGDFATHFFCHLCALCQEYREICERSGDPNYGDPKLPVITAPPVQKMEPRPRE